MSRTGIVSSGSCCAYMCVNMGSGSFAACQGTWQDPRKGEGGEREGFCGTVCVLRSEQRCNFGSVFFVMLCQGEVPPSRPVSAPAPWDLLLRI